MPMLLSAQGEPAFSNDFLHGLNEEPLPSPQAQSLAASLSIPLQIREAS